MNNSTQLNTTTGSGTQSSTGTPQSASSTNSLGTNSSAMQSSMTSSILTSQSGGIPLHSTPVLAYDLNQAVPGTTAESSSPASHHAPNGVLLGIAAVFIVLAIVLFWTTSRSAKTTTI